MRRKISVDSGKYSTKAIRKKSNDKPEESLVFMTKADETDTDFGTLCSGNTYRVEFNGKKYLVGDNAVHDSFVETKAEEIHRLCTYTAIAKLVDNGDEVSLVVGCPLSIFSNKEARKQYASFMKGSGEITIRVNNLVRHFTIVKVLVLPESAGVVYLNYNGYINKTVAVIDMGGLNTNGAVYKSIAPIPSTIFTTRLGGKEMVKSLLDILNTRLNLTVPIQMYQMDEIMKKGYVPSRTSKDLEEQSRKIIHEYRLQHIRNLYDACVSHDWSLDSLEIIFVGGTSLLLKDEIKEVFRVEEDSFFEDAEMLNARGFLVALA